MISELKRVGYGHKQGVLIGADWNDLVASSCCAGNDAKRFERYVDIKDIHHYNASAYALRPNQFVMPDYSSIDDYLDYRFAIVLRPLLNTLDYTQSFFIKWAVMNQNFLDRLALCRINILSSSLIFCGFD